MLLVILVVVNGSSNGIATSQHVLAVHATTHTVFAV
jgi:hypothetical protein